MNIINILYKEIIILAYRLTVLEVIQDYNAQRRRIKN